MCDAQPIIQWNVYYGVFNVTSSTTQWLPFSQMMTYDQIWFFGNLELLLQWPIFIPFYENLGRNNNQFTSTNRLFVENPAVQYWRFEVIYRFTSAISSSALSFVMNRPPSSGSCSISPSNGTTSTLFTITCSAWSDENGIKDYSIYGMPCLSMSLITPYPCVGWSTGSAGRMLISYSPASSSRIRLPAGDRDTSLLYLAVSIRDQLDCIAEVNISPVHVRADTVAINGLIEGMTSLSSQLTNNALVQLLSSGNQNTVGQVIASVSQQVNQMNSDNINRASASKNQH